MVYLQILALKLSSGGLKWHMLHPTCRMFTWKNARLKILLYSRSGTHRLSSYKVCMLHSQVLADLRELWLIRSDQNCVQLTPIASIVKRRE